MSDELWGEDGMPRHLPMGFNAEGQGPEDDDKAAFWGCWCMQDNCRWNEAFRRQQEISEQDGFRSARLKISNLIKDAYRNHRQVTARGILEELED
jgi:hypothetical protein